ncbi:unnamed protein product [Trichobilharzia szidati]|nr:unnamed protein product [Trichobilharzia szidati]
MEEVNSSQIDDNNPTDPEKNLSASSRKSSIEIVTEGTFEVSADSVVGKEETSLDVQGSVNASHENLYTSVIIQKELDTSDQLSDESANKISSETPTERVITLEHERIAQFSNNSDNFVEQGDPEGVHRSIYLTSSNNESADTLDNEGSSIDMRRKSSRITIEYDVPESEAKPEHSIEIVRSYDTDLNVDQEYDITPEHESASTISATHTPSETVPPETGEHLTAEVTVPPETGEHLTGEVQFLSQREYTQDSQNSLRSDSPGSSEKHSVEADMGETIEKTDETLKEFEGLKISNSEMKMNDSSDDLVEHEEIKHNDGEIQAQAPEYSVPQEDENHYETNDFSPNNDKSGFLPRTSSQDVEQFVSQHDYLVDSSNDIRLDSTSSEKVTEVEGTNVEDPFIPTDTSYTAEAENTVEYEEAQYGDQHEESHALNESEPISIEESVICMEGNESPSVETHLTEMQETPNRSQDIEEELTNAISSEVCHEKIRENEQSSNVVEDENIISSVESIHHINEHSADDICLPTLANENNAPEMLIQNSEEQLSHSRDDVACIQEAVIPTTTDTDFIYNKESEEQIIPTGIQQQSTQEVFEENIHDNSAVLLASDHYVNDQLLTTELLEDSPESFKLTAHIQNKEEYYNQLPEEFLTDENNEQQYESINESVQEKVLLNTTVEPNYAVVNGDYDSKTPISTEESFNKLEATTPLNGSEVKAKISKQTTDVDEISLNSEGDQRTEFEQRYAELIAKYLPFDRQMKLDSRSRRTKTLDRFNKSKINVNRYSYIDTTRDDKKRAVTLERNEFKRKRRPQPKPSVNDDYLYPDSVTPSKVDQSISVRSLEEGMPEGTYDVPYIDDDAFLPRKLRENKDEVDGSDDGSSLSLEDDYWSWNPNRLSTLEANHIADTNECAPTPDIQPKSKTITSILSKKKKSHQKQDLITKPMTNGDKQKNKGRLLLCGCVSRKSKKR